MMRDLILDFRVGGGSVPEIAQGIVRIWGTEVRPNGPSVVVTTETTLKLSNGQATLLNAQTSGTGPLYEWAYIIQVEPFHGRNFRFYVAIPDGTGPVNLKDLPKLNPYTGEGFYVDIEEWEALYGDLPDRVDALETGVATLNGLGQRGYIVDQASGRTVKVWDYLNSRDQMIYGATGERDISANLTPFVSGKVLLSRSGSWVQLSMDAVVLQAAASSYISYAGLIPAGFRPTQQYSYFSTVARTSADEISPIRVDLYGGLGVYGVRANENQYGLWVWRTNDPWPTTLPGIAVGAIPNT